MSMIDPSAHLVDARPGERTHGLDAPPSESQLSRARAELAENVDRLFREVSELHTALIPVLIETDQGAVLAQPTLRESRGAAAPLTDYVREQADRVENVIQRVVAMRLCLDL